MPVEFFLDRRDPVNRRDPVRRLTGTGKFRVESLELALNEAGTAEQTSVATGSAGGPAGQSCATMSLFAYFVSGPGLNTSQ